MSGGRIENGVPVADLVDLAVSPVARPTAVGPHQIDLFVRSPRVGFMPSGVESHHQRRAVSSGMGPISAADPFGDNIFNFNGL